jgi:hypothetical protein
LINFEQGNETLGSVKGGEVLDQLPPTLFYGDV